LKKRLLIFLFFCLSFFEFKAQDLINGAENLNIRFDNRYGPVHQTIKDTTKRTVSDFGHYFSIGIGVANEYKSAGFCGMVSYSLAYKSHLFSVTAAQSEIGLRNSADGGYKANYIGALVGESIRLKHILFSLSVGLACNDILIVDPSLYKYSVSSGVVYSNNYGISCPIELKAFFLTRGGLGIGLHLTENIVTTPKYSPFYVGVCVVLGKWNKKSNKVDNAFYKESVR